MLKTTAERLQYVRKHVLRISQAELGERMGITDAAITMREKGTTRITADDAQFLKETYGINPSKKHRPTILAIVHTWGMKF